MVRTASIVVLGLALGAGACGDSGAGSNCPPFSQIVGGDFGQIGDRLWWTLEVAMLPVALTFNQADVQADVLEYEWAVDLDSDRNGDADLRVAVSHFRQFGAPETVTSDILSVTSEDLWTVFGAGSTISGNVDVSISGNTFRFEAAIAEDPGLAQITERAQATWTTFHKFGPDIRDQCEDRRN
jgi:hypothetical protein